MDDPTRLGPGAEFDLIRRLRARWEGARVTAGTGDDAAVLDPLPEGERLVVSADSAIEGVHFRRDWLTPREIGWRAAAAAVSDLAAMAATPRGMLVSLGLPREWLPDLDALADGLADLAQATSATIVGGDLTAARDLTIAITVLGSAAQPLRRSAARPGDLVYATGRFGGPMAALRAWQHGRAPSPVARDRFVHPVPRLAEAAWLAAHGAHAAIDVSDGLLSEAAHLAAASDVAIELGLDPLPTLDDMPPDIAARSGEEYELLITAPHTLDAAAFQAAFGVPLTAIGRVAQGPARVDASLGGRRVAPDGGFDHFS